MSSTGIFLYGGVLGTFVGNSLGADNKKQAGEFIRPFWCVSSSAHLWGLVCMTR